MSTALVSLVDGIPTTTSKLVAETFGKRHSDVLRDIERVCTQVPENFRERNFASASYEQESTFGKKASKLYLLTRGRPFTGDTVTSSSCRAKPAT